MAKKRLTVIGAGGQMGSWFAKYFVDLGYDVTGYDSEQKIPVKNITVVESLVSGVLRTDYVVPVSYTHLTLPTNREV